jgi:hypothetical protein
MISYKYQQPANDVLDKSSAGSRHTLFCFMSVKIVTVKAQRKSTQQQIQQNNE